MTDKVVILARGLGTRMKRQDDGAKLDDRSSAAADTGIKALIPIDRPFLDYVLTGLAKAGFRQVCLVVGPQQEAIRDYYGRQVKPKQVTISFAVQEEPRGTSDAVYAAEAFAGSDSFVVLNSDNYYPHEALAGLQQGDGFGVALFEWQSMLADSNIPEERLRQFSVGQIDAQGCLQRILEKPDTQTLAALPRPLWISMNCWRFGPDIFQACRAIKPSPRGEFEVTDSVQYTIDVLKQRYPVTKVSGPVLDLSSRQDIGPVRQKLAGSEVRF